MTRQHKRNLANLVLLHGYDNLLEFYDEITGGDVGLTNANKYPWLSQAQEVLDGWHQRIIEIADKGAT